MAQNEQPVVRAHDISYSKRSYRSFEFASFSVGAGEVLAVLSSSHAPARDLLLAIAGLVRPTSGTLVVAGTDLTAARTLPFGLGTRLSRTTAGLGVFEHVAPVQSVCTVEEAVAREMRLCNPRGGTSDALPPACRDGCRHARGRAGIPARSSVARPPFRRASTRRRAPRRAHRPHGSLRERSFGKRRVRTHGMPSRIRFRVRARGGRCDWRGACDACGVERSLAR